MRFRLIAVVVLVLGVGMSAPRAQQEANLALLSVPLSAEYGDADSELARRLGVMLSNDIQHDDNFNTYGDLIERLTTTKDPYLARMTPYAFVAAEMLGARFEVLGTYESRATATTTYRSYFVVNARKFAAFPPTLDGVYQYLESQPRPARFIYHDKFSTSSFLLPALWFRTHRIFATDQPATSVVRVAPVQGAASSGESVEKVAADDADLAAVWDGTKLKYAGNPDVLFIPLVETLPNDLLVASTSLPEQTRTVIRKAIDSSDPIDIGDFKRWRSIDTAREALEALNALKRVARAAPAPVVVRVNTDATADEQVAGLLAGYADDARQAIRLAGTEFVLEEPKFHEAVDVVWTVTSAHEGTIVLVSEMPGLKDDLRARLRQAFHISFTTAEGDLTRRIVSLIHSRMHRIRYIWPYKDSAPTVIRDVDFTISEAERVHVQRMTWRDPDRNDFVAAGSFDTVPAEISAATFAFDRRDFVRTDTGTLDFQNPLSDVAYRVILERRSHESALSKILTGTLIGLLLLTGAGAGVDLRRRLIPGKPAPPRTLPDVCAALAARVHARWRDRPLKDADVLCCTRPRIEEQIEELKSKGLVPAAMGGVTRWAYQFTAGASLPFVRGAVSGQASRHVDLILDPAKVGNTVRLDALLKLMTHKGLLSRFVGGPLEWDALNDLARSILPGAEAGDLIIRPEDETVVKIASRHFSQVLEDGQERLSLLHGSWTLAKRDDRCLARQRIDLKGPIIVGTARVSAIVMEFNIADEVELPLDAASRALDCWVLGKIVRTSIVDDAGRPALSLHMRTVALLAEGLGPRQVVTMQASDIGADAPIGE